MLKQWICALATVLILAGAAWADIWKAAANGDVQAVQKEIARGVGVNAKDEDLWTPLHYAVEQRKMDVVKLLLAQGASVNEQTIGLARQRSNLPLNMGTRQWLRSFFEKAPMSM